MKYEVAYNTEYCGQDNTIIVEADEVFHNESYLHFVNKDESIVAIFKDWIRVVKVKE